MRDHSFKAKCTIYNFLRQMLTKMFYLTLDVLNTHIQFLFSYSLETTYTKVIL